MLGIDTRAARAAWTVFLIALLLAVVYFIRKILVVFIIAVLFAYLLSPVVNLLDRFLPWRRSRGVAMVLVYLGLLGLLVGMGFLIGQRVTQEATDLEKKFPELVAKVQKDLESPTGPAWLRPAKRYLLEEIRDRAQTFGKAVVPLLQKATQHVLSVLSSLVIIVLIPILGFFFLKDGRELRDQALDFATGEQREMWEDILADLHQLLGQFIRALVILALATFFFYSVFFSIIGLPYSVLLASIAAVLEFIPVFGPLTAAVIITLVAALTGTGHILLILAFLGAYRIFQDYILNPHLMSSGVALHPMLVIFGVLAGEEIAGVPGMFFSVPVLATLRVIYVRIRKARVVSPPPVPASS